DQRLVAYPEPGIDQVDADVLAALQGQRRSHEEVGAGQHVAELEGPDGRRAEEVAGEDLVAGRQHQRDDEQRREAAHAEVDALDGADQRPHARFPPSRRRTWGGAARPRPAFRYSLTLTLR